jgi:diphthine synthase
MFKNRLIKNLVMLYLIGLGLSWKDLSLKALEILNKCDEIYIENYTSVADFTIEQLSRLLGKKVISLDRKKTEEEMPFLKNAHIKEIALLTFGDALSATTHFEILQIAKKKKFETKVIHAPSIFTAVAETGLSLYRFGKTASIPIPEKDFAPESFFDTLVENMSIGAHTLFLLDLKPHEKRFLTIPEAIDILLDINNKRKSKLFTEKTFCIGCARLGSDNQIIKAGTTSELHDADFGNPPFCLIVPAKLSHKEEEYVKR